MRTVYIKLARTGVLRVVCSDAVYYSIKPYLLDETSAEVVAYIATNK